MADTTHNVTIKATLDTSTNDSTSNRSGSTSCGGGSGSSSRNYGTTIAGATITLNAFARTIQLCVLAFTSLTTRLQEFSIRLAQISNAYLLANEQKFTNK